MAPFLFLTLLWGFFLILMVVGTLTLFKQLRRSPRQRWFANQFVPTPVSILKPLKGADPSLTENLRSFFLLDSAAPFELLFSVESKKDPAYPIVKELMDTYSRVDARIFFSNETADDFAHIGMNPKLKNIARSYDEAKYDVVLISDSNVRVNPDELDHLTFKLDSDTGLVTSIVAGTRFKGIGGFLEAVFLNTFYARFMALSNEYAKPCVVGKSMLFRRSTAKRFGGLKILSQFLAEDFMAGESMSKLGLKVKTAVQPVNQIIGKHSFQDFWKRHIRWGRIRKAHAPLAFCFEPFSNSFVVCTLGSIGIHHFFGTPLWMTTTLSLTLWGGLDWIQFATLSQTSFSKNLLFPFIWIIREALALPLWIQILSGNGVDWRGNRLNLARGGLLSETQTKQIA
jgi:ceramide glucosyltransferase